MPKIPTFTSKTEMTTSSPHVKSNIQMDPGSNIYTATKPLQNFLVNEYVKEKKLEADNKSTLALSDLYINQENGTKGLYTIQSETASNGNPTDAANFFDEHINKLWSYAEATKISDLDNFTKKALEKKFYATAGMFKVKALEDSRNTQFQITKKITNDFVMKDALALKLNGIDYLDIYKNNVLSRIEQDTTLKDAGVKKKQAELYLKFGQNALAASLVSSQPEIFKENIDKFDALNVDEKLKLIAVADKTIKDQTFNTLTNAIDQVGIMDIPPAALSKITNEIITGNFNNNKSLQNLYNSLTDIEKQEFSTFVAKKARAKRNELLFEISSSDAAVKLENAKKFKDALESAGVDKGIDQKFIDKVFQDNSEEKDQLTNMNNKLTTNIEKNINVSSDNDKNVSISSLISSDEINTLTDKFTLPGEIEAKSIVERYGNGISKDDLDYYAEILLQQNENPKQFEKTFVPFHSFLNEMSNLISTEVIKILDPKSYNNDLIRFRDDMYIKYNEGLKEGKTPLELLDYKNKNFIGNDFISYQTDKNKIFKNMMKENVGDKTVIPKLEGETPDEYLIRTTNKNIKASKINFVTDIFLGKDRDVINNWNEHYQTDNTFENAAKAKNRLKEDWKVPVEKYTPSDGVIKKLKAIGATKKDFERLNKQDLIKAIEITASNFAGDNGYSKEDYKKLLAQIAQIETKYETIIQRTDKPVTEDEEFLASSFWQMEVATAKDLLENSSPVFGPMFESTFEEYKSDKYKTVVESLFNLSDRELVILLRTDFTLAAHFAAAIISSRFNTKKT